MSFSGFELSSYAYYKYCSFLFCYGIFSFFRSKRWIQLTKFFGMNKGYFGRQTWSDSRKAFRYKILGTQKRSVNATNYAFQKVDITFFGSHYTLPVPLINIK